MEINREPFFRTLSISIRWYNGSIQVTFKAIWANLVTELHFNLAIRESKLAEESSRLRTPRYLRTMHKLDSYSFIGQKGNTWALVIYIEENDAACSQVLSADSECGKLFRFFPQELAQHLSALMGMLSLKFEPILTKFGSGENRSLYSNFFDS
ncbi:hypothetical protein LguiA_002194 [Lonicera macranthoides]